MATICEKEKREKAGGLLDATGVASRILLASAAWLLAACTHVVVPPSEPEDPVDVFLLDHGRHASVALPRDKGVTRYSYGHWGWYVKNRTGLRRASGALFGPSTAGLGRRHLPGPPTMAALRAQVRVPIEAAWRIPVAADRAADLTGRLDALFRERAATLVANPLYDLEFVRHPVPYSIGHNSNHMASKWLRALGCRVVMRGPMSWWRVAAPAQSFKASGASTVPAATRSPVILYFVSATPTGATPPPPSNRLSAPRTSLE